MIVCAYCLLEIFKQVVYSLTITKSIKVLKDIPDDQRSIILEKLLNYKESNK